MHIKLMAIWGAIVVGAGWLRKWYNEFSSVIIPIIQQVEEMAKDGKINKDDRKAIVMKAIALLQAQNKLRKFNLFEEIIVSKVVDYIAEKLPDFTVSSNVENILQTFVKPQ